MICGKFLRCIRLYGAYGVLCLGPLNCFSISVCDVLVRCVFRLPELYKTRESNVGLLDVWDGHT
jgi:hypothetical protein